MQDLRDNYVYMRLIFIHEINAIYNYVDTQHI